MSLTRPQTAGPLVSARGAALLRGRTSGQLNKLWVVAVDGSLLSVQALHVTAALLTPGDQVRIITVSVGVTDLPDPSEDLSLTSGSKLSPEGLLMASKVELLTRGVPSRSISTELVDPDEKSIAEALSSETNLLRRNAGILVIGATGKGAMKRSGGAGANMMGKVAEQLLLSCKCPICLVKGGRLPIYPDGPIKSLRPPCTLVACADRSQVSTGAFDAALRMCRENDTLHILHVEASSRADEEIKIKHAWTDVAAKVEASGKGVSVVYNGIPKTNSSIVEAILDFCAASNCQAVCLGSIELVKKKPLDGKGAQAISLGSVAQAVARRCAAHTIIVKNFSAI